MFGGIFDNITWADIAPYRPFLLAFWTVTLLFVFLELYEMELSLVFELTQEPTFRANPLNDLDLGALTDFEDSALLALDSAAFLCQDVSLFTDLTSFLLLLPGLLTSLGLLEGRELR